MQTHTDIANWTSLLERLDLASDATTHDDLLAAYSGPDRHYHTVAHIDDCLNELVACEIAPNEADPIALAIWFHDAVYSWRSKTNEADSARWAQEFIGNAGGQADLSYHIDALIMATCHFLPEPLIGDRALMADIDLSILGREPDVYNQYETAIRKEYRWVPDIIYRRERAKVLQAFQARDCIFLTDRFTELYETQARRNLASAIEAL